MKFLLIILNREKHLEKVLSLMLETGISGATILESEGIGHFLAYEVPIFAGLRQLVGERKAANKTIFAVLEDESLFPKFNELLKEEGIDFNLPGVGVMALLPVEKAFKPKKEE